MSTLLEVLPEEFPDKLCLLEGILEKGIARLLEEARLKGYSKEPYGRRVEPSPLMSEEEFTNSSAVDESLDSNDEPTFDFEYGFNPMTYLANYIRWSHPDSVRERQFERERCVERLQRRAMHAFIQLDTLRSLTETVHQQGSLVIWGPISMPLSSTSVITFFQPGRGGTFSLEISENENFTSINQRKVLEIVDLKRDGQEDSDDAQSVDSFPQAMQIIIDGLIPSTKYYLRLYMQGVNDSLEIKHKVADVTNLPFEDGDAVVTEGIEDSGHEARGGISSSTNDALVEDTEVHSKFFSQFCSFWTLPGDDDDDGAEDRHDISFDGPLHQTKSERMDSGANHMNMEIEIKNSDQRPEYTPVRFHCVHANLLPDVMPDAEFNLSSIDENSGIPMLTCLIGDPVAAPASATQIEQEEYSINTWKLYTQNAALRSNISLLRNSSLVLAWNDSRFGSDVDIRAEEVAFKRFTYDTKKYAKKYGKGGKKANSKAPPPPVLVRPQVSKSLLSLTAALPVDFMEEECSARHIYRTMMLGPYVQLIMLDLRSGYMSKEQAKWVKDTLLTSSALWKIVVSGLPIGVEANENAIDSVHGGGNRPNSRHRARIQSGTVSVQGETMSDIREEESDEEARRSKMNARVQSPNIDKSEGDKEDCDEFGRSKTSLPYLMSSLHRHFERKKSANTENETAEDENSQGVVSAGAKDNSTCNKSDSPLENNEGGAAIFKDAKHADKTDEKTSDMSAIVENEPSPLEVESGIVFISSNPSSDFGFAPFMALYDPADTGTNFCAEINIGTSGSSDKTKDFARGFVTDHLNSKFILEEKLTQLPTSHQYQLMLQLNTSGALAVSIKEASEMTLPSCDEVITSQTFVVA